MAGMPDEQLIAQLAGRARAEGLRLTGEDGVLSRLTKGVVESALEGEMDDHLGYGKHDAAGRDRGDSRNGKRAETVLTEAGPRPGAGPPGRRVALAVTVEGTRDVLGLWAGEHGDGEGAKFWLRVLSEIKNRGTGDVCIVVCDGLKGLPDAVAQVWPQTIVQTCIVHLLRNSFRY